MDKSKQLRRQFSSFYHEEKKTAIQRLLEQNQQWRENKTQQDPEFFQKISSRQLPSYLWIGCSDSRVPAEEITGLQTGELFVHRNIANLVINTDLSALSVISYAVEHLLVQDIIVCGHYNCGGCKAALTHQDYGLLDNWLKNLRDVHRLHYTELSSIEDEKERERRFVELNVMEQCLNLHKSGIIQQYQRKYGYPRIHGLVYDLETGELKRIPSIDYEAIFPEHYQNLYSVLPEEHGKHEMLTRRHAQCRLIEQKKWDEESDNQIKDDLLDHPDVFTESELDSAFKALGSKISKKELIKYFENL